MSRSWVSTRTLVKSTLTSVGQLCRKPGTYTSCEAAKRLPIPRFPRIFRPGPRNYYRRAGYLTGGLLRGLLTMNKRWLRIGLLVTGSAAILAAATLLLFLNLRSDAAFVNSVHKQILS